MSQDKPVRISKLKPVLTQRNAIDFAQLIGDVIDEKDNK